MSQILTPAPFARLQKFIQVLMMPVLITAVPVLRAAGQYLLGGLTSGLIPVQVEVDLPVFFQGGERFFQKGKGVEHQEVDPG